LYKYRFIQTIGIGYYTRCVYVRPSEWGKPSPRFLCRLTALINLL
jgi:hypothetical protein